MALVFMRHLLWKFWDTGVARGILRAFHPQCTRFSWPRNTCDWFGGKGLDLNPIDLAAMEIASCMIIVMSKSTERKGLDLTGTWAEKSYKLKDYKIAPSAVNIDSPQSLSVDDRAFLEKESRRCPVYLAVKDAVKANVAFAWGSTAVPRATTSYARCG
jgi:uncharacterized OsmC-like protein